MMIVNGAANPSQGYPEPPNGPGYASAAVWSENVPIVAGNSYTFTAWAASNVSLAPPDIVFQLGGTTLGKLQLTLLDTGVWTEFTRTFTAATGGSQAIAVFDATPDFVGNDFALDDISLVSNTAAVREPSRLVAFLGFAGMGLIGLVWRRRAAA